jgi:flavodoxin
MKTLLVLVSYHHHNTEKIANVFANVLDAPIKTPQQVRPEELEAYDLVGFGSGIYSSKHHTDLLDLADNLPPVTGRKAFIFSTSAIISKDRQGPFPPLATEFTDDVKHKIELINLRKTVDEFQKKIVSADSQKDLIDIGVHYGEDLQAGV